MSERIQVWALSLVVVAFGVSYATTVAGGSDSYGYVSQADLWLTGDLRIEQPWIEDADWSSRRMSFAPLGYRGFNDDFAMVPTYAPGLPMLMAAAKYLAGQEAMFWVVPLMGGVLVLATWGVGRRVAPAGAAVTAAWITACSPVLLYMVVWPMSDVPVAALWMVACYGLLRPGRLAAMGGGLAAALAIMVRPNLAFLVVILATWPVWQLGGLGDIRRRAWWRMALFVLCASPGALVVATINQQLYGSPFESGYGSLSSMFDRTHFWPNLVNYASWLVESHTLAGAAGLAALFLPWRRLWPEVEHRRFLLVSAGIVVSVWTFYCFYYTYDAWWFLRFMLPTLPFIALGTGAIVASLWRTGIASPRFVAAVGLAAVVLTQLQFVETSGVLALWHGERRYVRVGQVVGTLIPEDSIVISNQHSGSLRYYGGRMTLRFENLDGDSLDTVVAWASSRGHHPYMLLEEWELPLVRERFAGQAALARIESPLMVYDGPIRVMLFDLSEDVAGPIEVSHQRGGLRSVPPAPPAPLMRE